MPALEHLKHVFQTEFGHDFSKLPNRHTTLFVIVQHGFISIRPMMDAFLELGIPNNHVFMTTKPHTTSSEMQTYFQNTFTHYIPFQWPAQESTSSLQARYKHLTAVTHRQLFDNFCDYLLRYPMPAHIQNIIICDEGGKFLNEFIERYHNPDSRYLKKLSDYHVVAIEHTKCGMYSEALSRLPFPLINMADSYLKTQIESEYIAKSMFVNLNLILTRIIDSASVKIGVVGGGNIGRKVLGFLIKEYSASFIIMYDRAPSVLSQVKIVEEGWLNVTRADSIQSLFQQANIILGCTGKDITSTLSSDSIAENPADKIHLISCSSGDVEFHTLLQRMPNYDFRSLADVRDWTIPLDAEGNKQLIIYNGGFPMNFLVEQPAAIPAPESVPLQEVQITRSMKLATLVQALKLLEVTAFIPNENSLTGYMQLDALYQWEIIQALYHDLMKSDLPEKRVEAERKYAHITKQEIAQGSVGALQPSMSLVLRIPNYITTQYQVRMQDQLLRQDAPIKLLVIHGTTGSGKTTLAQHALQKQRIQSPEHLSRVLLAETKGQWRASLRDWAEELFPELNALLKAEQDSQRQDRLVNQHLQKALRMQKWYVVIDNWDQNALHIGEIERLFLNQESNVGNGTLIITTQGKSSYGKINSLDLSQGFAPDESRGLLIKVMNLEEEISIDWQALGSDVDLQALTTFLNHLPLATVLAGSYLMWENKSRQSGSESQQLFTYVDYRQMLERHVAELISAHDEQLGGRGRIPREDRAEFIHVKTQEAAVDLSLRRAIQTDSINPNMNLWQMLCFCGFLASDGIPQQLLKDYIEKILPEDEQEIHETFFEMLLHEAQKYSLLQFENIQSSIDSLPSLHMHRVIQHVLRDNYWSRLTIASEENSSFQSNERSLRINMEKALLDRFDPALEKECFEIIRTYCSHIEAMLQAFIRKSVTSSLEKDISAIPLENSLALAKLLLGDYASAKALYEKALATKIAHYGEAHVSVADTEESLAIILRQLGDYTGAKALYEKALATKIAHYGMTHVSVADTQQNLALALEKLGEYMRAQVLYEHALETKLAHYPNEAYVSVAKTQQNLAGNLLQFGNYSKAEALYRKSLATMIAHYGEKHVTVAGVQHNLAVILMRLGRDEDAQVLCEEALATMIAHYGETHIEVAGPQQNLAMILSQLGNLKTAITLTEKSLRTMIAHYGEAHIEVAGTQRTLADILQGLGDYQKAKDLYEKVLVTVIAYSDGEADIRVAETQENFAVLLTKLEKYERAKGLYEKALATKIVHYGETHIRVAITQHTFAELLCRLDDFPRADLLLEICEKTFKTQAGGRQYLARCSLLKKIVTAHILREKAHEALVLGKYEEAISGYDYLIELDPENSAYFNNAACAYHLLGLQQETSEFFIKAQEHFEHALALEKLIFTQVEYVNFLRERGKYSEALELLDNLLQQNPIEGDGYLSYNLMEIAVLPPAFAEKIRTEGPVTINHPIFFAYYLKIICLLADSPAEATIILKCQESFNNAIVAFKENHTESFLPIYEWFLKNASELIKNQRVTAVSSEGTIEISEDWQENCHTLFAHGYCFSLEKHENTLKLTRINEPINHEPIKQLCKHTRSSCAFFMTHDLGLNIVDSTERGFSFVGHSEAIKMANTIFSEIRNDIAESALNSEGDTIDSFCRIS